MGYVIEACISHVRFVAARESPGAGTRSMHSCV
jgi:hypothetical protein